MSTKSQVSNKYNSRGVWVDKKTMAILTNPTKDQKTCAYHFDSTLEYEIFLNLRKISIPNLKIVVHPRVEIASFKKVLSNYKSVNFWKPDFLVTKRNNQNKVISQLIIECKGLILQPFPYQYALFCEKYPSIPVFLIRNQSDYVRQIDKILEVLRAN